MRNNIAKHIRTLSLFLLILLLGGIDAWGQTDYSGTYYIASGDVRGSNNKSDIHYSSETPANNFYLCPTDEENWICYVDPDNYTNPAEDNDQPFLTTYKYRASGEDATQAQWVIKKVPNSEYYHIIHQKTSRYLTCNKKIESTSGRGVNRLRFHLQSTATDNSLFRIDQDADVPTAINIVAVAAIDKDGYYYNDGGQKNCIYLNLSSADNNTLTGTDGKKDGPTYCKNVGATIGIWYDAGRSSEWFLEEVVPRTTITNTNSNIVFSHSEEGATIYYTTDGTNPTTTNYAGTGTAPLQIDMPENAVTVKAIATIDNLPSCISKTRVVPAASITLAQTEYTYTSSAIEPVVSSVKDGETTIDANEYTVSYSNNINVGNSATVTITDKAGGDYIVYGSTTFTINPASVTLTANSGTEAYDGTEKTLNGFTCTVNGLTFTGVSASGSGTNIGDYPVTFTGVTIGTTKDTSGNYVVSETVNGTLTITPKSLTITADSDTKVYDGTALTKNSYTSEGLMEGDVIESVTITGSQTEAGSSDNVPSAAVIKKGDEVVNANYTITYTNGTLTINPKPLTIIADAKTKAYGEADPALTYTSDGLINDDAITGALTREAGENAGDYAINQGTLSAGDNYAIAYTGANLTITKVGLTITAKNNTITYGDAPAGNGVTYEGFVNSETASVLGGTLDYDYSYVQYGNVGNTYKITPKGLTSSNYNITFVAGKLTVTAKEVGINWTNTAFAYDGEEHVPTATATGLVNGDEVGVTVTGAQRNIGNYTATASALTGDKAGNYVLPEAKTQTFTISSKSIGDGTNLTEGYTLDFGEGNTILLTDDNGKTLVLSTDYSVSDDGDASEQYSSRTVTGIGNYTGSFTVRNAIVSFTTDTNQYEWSATFVAEKADEEDVGFVLPEGFMAFIITGIRGEWAIPEPLNYIPAGVPVLLVAHRQTYGFVAKKAVSSEVTVITDDQKTSNMLKEVTTESAHFDTKEIYLLYKNEFVFNKAGNLNRGKVYLKPNSSDPAPARLQIAWNQTTDIQDLQDNNKASMQGDVWYTIDGRRLNGKPSARGLYIVDGKKTVVK